MDKIHLNLTSPPFFKFPADYIVSLKDQVPESALAKPLMRRRVLARLQERREDWYDHR